MSSPRKYRGIRVGTEEWVKGWYLEKDGGSIIYPIDKSGYSYLVIPETVGQQAGLKDKNGKEIYEGDIVGTGFWRGVVTFVDGAFKIIQAGCSDDNLGDAVDVIEIIGDIHTTPHLLGDK